MVEELSCTREECVQVCVKVASPLYEEAPGRADFLSEMLDGHVLGVKQCLLLVLVD